MSACGTCTTLVKLSASRPGEPLPRLDPHAYRRTAYKLAYQAAQRIKAAAPLDTAHIPAERYAEILIDHRVQGMNYDNTHQRRGK